MPIRFREDLYFRLKVVEIEVPPQRKRWGDIEIVALALLGRVREETQRDVRRISDDAMARLVACGLAGLVCGPRAGCPLSLDQDDAVGPGE